MPCIWCCFGKCICISIDQYVDLYLKMYLYLYLYVYLFMLLYLYLYLYLCLCLCLALTLAHFLALENIPLATSETQYNALNSISQ